MEVNTAQGNPLGWTPPEWVTAAGTKPECQEQRKVELPDLRNKKIHELVLKLNSFDPKNLPEDAMAFYIKFQIVGYINKRVAPDLPKEFKITHTEIYLNEKVEESMNAAISIMKNHLIEKYPMLKGWRNEEYSIWSENGPVASLDRSASSIFGIRTYGTHLNAYTKDPETNLIKMWVAKRSQTKQTFPGFLDNMAAGGMGIGQKQLGPRENMIKEAYEEAGVSPELMKNAKLTGQVSNYECRQDGCFQPSTNFVFDLEVPKDFVPRITDGEVESFEMWDMDQVRMRIKEFKPEAALVIVDFLIRHGAKKEREVEKLKLEADIKRKEKEEEISSLQEQRKEEEAQRALHYAIYLNGALPDKTVPIPIWILAFMGLSIDLGLVTFGYHVMRSLGNNITYQSPSCGFSMELGAAMTVIIASFLGIAVSTTHCITGATVAVGLCNINWKVVSWTIFSWVITIPVAGVIAGALFKLLLSSPHF